MSLRTVSIVQRRLTHYRVPFFEHLRQLLGSEGIKLNLLVGRSTEVEEQKRDRGVLEWAKPTPIKYFGQRLCWQSVVSEVQKADLAIVPQENGLLVNHVLLHFLRPSRLAFWGHGGNFQNTNRSSFSEAYKRWTTTKVDWWFAYTELSAARVAAAGFPQNKISVLNNSIDTTSLGLHFSSVTRNEILELRASLDLDDGPVGLYVGSIYQEKRLDFLLEAAEAIRSRVRDFNLVIIGDGPMAGEVAAWAHRHSWARYVGPKFGREKAVYMAMAELMLNPGLVGLGILDSFACELPMITTDCRIHSPEIAYLKSGENGLMTANALSEFVDESVRLFSSPGRVAELRSGCRRASSLYTIENMAENFCDGIKSALLA